MTTKHEDADLDTLNFWYQHHLSKGNTAKAASYAKTIKMITGHAPGEPEEKRHSKKSSANGHKSTTTPRTPMTPAEKKAKKLARRQAKRIQKYMAKKILLDGVAYPFFPDDPDLEGKPVIYSAEEDAFNSPEGDRYLDRSDSPYADWTTLSTTAMTNEEKKAKRAARRAAKREAAGKAPAAPKMTPDQKKAKKTAKRAELKAEYEFWKDGVDQAILKAKKSHKKAPVFSPFDPTLVIRIGYEIAKDNDKHLTDFGAAVQMAFEGDPVTGSRMDAPASLKQYKQLLSRFHKEFPKNIASL